MIEIIWRHDPRAEIEEIKPRTAAEARVRLEEGSTVFAELTARGGRHIVVLPPDALGLPSRPDGSLAQEPFAAVLGCSDARVPAELIFGQAANDLFVVRVAGNVPGTECLGSLDFAVSNLASLRLLAVVGHTGCGAVTAAVDAFLSPETYFAVAGNLDLRAIVDAIMVAVTTAADAMVDVYGAEVTKEPAYRAALIETAAVVNAAFTAALIGREMKAVRSDRLGIVFGIYDLTRRSVGLPSASGWQPGLADPPESAAALGDLARQAARAVQLR